MALSFVRLLVHAAVCGSMALSCSSAAYAQPTREKDGRTEIYVPTNVVLQRSGEAKVEAAWIALPAGAAVAGTRPASIGIFSERLDGTRIAGIELRNDTQENQTRLTYQLPLYIELANGVYTAKLDAHSMDNFELPFPPGWSHVLSQPRVANVQYDATSRPVGSFRPRAGWEIHWNFDDANGLAAWGNQKRYDAIKSAFQRAKYRVQTVFSNCTGGATFDVHYENPSPGSVDAIASMSSEHVFPGYTIARQSIYDSALGNSEPTAETNMYDFLPGSGGVHYVWATGGATRTSALVGMTTPLATHIGGIFGSAGVPVSGPAVDGILRIRPEFGPSATVIWKAFSGPCSATKPELSCTLCHEIFHGLGFESIAEAASEPTNTLFVWDLFRVAESAVPVTAFLYPSAVRELRPTVEAKSITQLGTASGSNRLARGKRTGGDGDQASHWRGKPRLGGDPSIGIMDPASGTFECETGKPRYFARADLDALDVIGWNLDPASANYRIASTISPTAPSTAQIVTTARVTFAWTDDGSPNSWSLFVYPGTDTTTDDPTAAVEEIFGTTTTLADPLPHGPYSWYVVGNYDDGIEISSSGTFVASCPADFNASGDLSAQDIFDFLNAWFAGDPSADFNQVDGLSVQDIFDFLGAWFTGCP